MNITYDNRGGIYEIPNYCINDPSVYIIDQINIKSKPEKESIDLIIRKGVENIRVTCLNLDTIERLKEEICKNEIKFEKSKMRLYFSGKHCEDKEELWSYRIVNNSILQMLYKE